MRNLLAVVLLGLCIGGAAEAKPAICVEGSRNRMANGVACWNEKCVDVAANKEVPYAQPYELNKDGARVCNGGTCAPVKEKLAAELRAFAAIPDKTKNDYRTWFVYRVTVSTDRRFVVVSFEAEDRPTSAVLWDVAKDAPVTPAKPKGFEDDGVTVEIVGNALIASAGFDARDRKAWVMRGDGSVATKPFAAFQLASFGSGGFVTATVAYAGKSDQLVVYSATGAKQQTLALPEPLKNVIDLTGVPGHPDEIAVIGGNDGEDGYALLQIAGAKAKLLTWDVPSYCPTRKR